MTELGYRADQGEGDPVLVHRVIARLNVGGPAMHVVHLARDLDDGGEFRTRLLAGWLGPEEGDMSYYAREREVEVTEIPALSRRLNPLSDLRALLSLYRCFRRESPDVVHTHTAKAGTLGRLAAWLAGVPVRIHTFHGHVLGGDYFSPWMTAFFRTVERLLGRITHRLVVLSEAQKREMSEELEVAPREKFAVIPLGLELERFVLSEPEETRRRTREKLGIPRNAGVIGVVGRLVPVKNHELLFRAVARLTWRVEEMGPKAFRRPLRVMVVGSGEREDELKALARELRIDDRVLWLGWRRDLPELYAAMDVLALPSRDEGTPVAVIEAMAAGVPVVARAVGGVEELLHDARMGWLLHEESVGDMARALAEVLTDPPPPAIGKHSSAWVRQRFSLERLARDMGALYRDALRECSR